VLKLLLDEHVSPEVARGLRRRARGLIVFSLAEWECGSFLGQEDAALLREAARQQLTSVTYDRRTIPPLLKDWAEAGVRHGGVIFLDEKSISPADIGGLVRALTALVKDQRQLDWTDRVSFLRL